MDYGAQRMAENQALFRSANERIKDRVAALEESEADRVPFLCECPNVDCTERIMLTLAEYEHVRPDPTWFVVRPGHERPEIDEVLERHETYLLVRKYGKAGAIAEELYERG
jgi:hypothetical protein